MCFKCPAPARAVGGVGSHSDIYDMPVYPDDTAPKILEGHPLAIEWIPFVSATCEDENGNVLMLYVSMFLRASETASCKVWFKGTLYSMSVDTSTTVFEDGVLTVGTMSRIVVDYNVPHNISCFFSATRHLNFTVAFRGSPLWYSKQVNEIDMLSVHQDIVVGGYDAPSKIVGVWHDKDATTEFSGYGVCEHTWLIGDESTFFNSHMLWMVFNDENSYGVIFESKHSETGELLAKTGRLWSNGQTYIFDDFTWRDDGEVGHQAPKIISISGTARDLLDNEAYVDLQTNPEESFNPFGHDIWMFHRITGTVNGLEFDGYSHCEVRRIFSNPVVNPPNPSPTPTSSPSPSPSFFPSPSPSLSPSPSPSSSQQPIPTEKPQPNPSPPAEIIYPVAVGISCAVIVTLTFLLKRKRRPRAKEHI